MPDFVLIEVATGFAPWVFSWWHIGLFVLGLVLCVLLGIWVYRGFGTLDSLIGSSLLLMCVVVGAGMVSVTLGSDYISDEEAQRVSDEIHEVTGSDVSTEEVHDMQKEKYVPGVNYEVLEDSEGEIVFKVEK